MQMEEHGKRPSDSLFRAWGGQSLATDRVSRLYVKDVCLGNPKVVDRSSCHSGYPLLNLLILVQ